MRSFLGLGALSLITVLFSVGCATETEEDDTGDQTSNVTGGSGTVESPVVYLFDATADAKASPKCAGALLGDKVAITAKSCAKEGLAIGRAADKDGHGARGKITKVIVPPGEGVDIALVEIDKDLGGVHARITHMPFRDGYAINSVASLDGGFFSPDKNEAASIKGAIVDEDALHASILPAKGTQICDGDMGAPVCSSTGASFAGFNIAGTCGLSGLVVEAAAPPSAATPTTKGAPVCSSGAAKVTALGRYAAFLKQHAPQAFEPLRIDEPIIRNYAFVPEGLWGYKTKGDVKTCKIDTATLANVPPSNASAKITVKVSFASMDKYASAFGRFGLAPKADPTKVLWLPAKPVGKTTGTAFDTSFEGVVSADKEGDYSIVFRASANGGETWSTCDTTGIVTGTTAGKPLGLTVAKPGAQPPATPPSDTPSTTPESTPTAPSSYGDAPPADESSTEDPSEAGDPEGGPIVNDPTTPAKKKKTTSGGCSTAPGSSNGTSSLPIAAALLGLAVVARRRRKDA